MSAPAAGGTALHTAVDSNMRDSVRVLVEECGARLDQVRLGMVMVMMMVMMMIMRIMIMMMVMVCASC